jgi:VanZ family protein
MNNFWRFRAPAILWALTLFTLSSIPKLSSPFHLSKWDDKLNHLVAYALLGALALRALTAEQPAPGKRELGLALSLSISYGIIDEIHQYFVPGRFSEVMDVMADATGTLIGMGFYFLLCWRNRRRAPSRHGSLE